MGLKVAFCHLGWLELELELLHVVFLFQEEPVNMEKTDCLPWWFSFDSLSCFSGNTECWFVSMIGYS